MFDTMQQRQQQKQQKMSFGTIRALISPNSGIIFDAHTPTVELVAEELSILFQKISANNEEKATLKQDQKYTENDNANANDGDDEPFELVFIEEVLREVCDMYARRLKLYEPIVNAVSSRVTNEMFAATGIHRLVPVKDSIQEFEIQVQSALDCLKHLLDNDEDMVGLLLQKKMKAKHEGYELDLKNHEAVELLIEEYARRLNCKEIDEINRGGEICLPTLLLLSVHFTDRFNTFFFLSFFDSLVLFCPKLFSYFT